MMDFPRSTACAVASGALKHNSRRSDFDWLVSGLYPLINK